MYVTISRQREEEGKIMAWVSQGFILDVRQVDAGANENRKTYNLTAATNAEALTESLEILVALEEVSALSSKTYTIREVFVNDAFALPAAGVQGEAKAVIVGRNSADASKLHRVEISGPEDDVFLATQGELANVVDLTHQHVKDYWNLFDGTGQATLSDGESVETDGLTKGYRRTASKKYG